MSDKPDKDESSSELTIEHKEKVNVWLREKLGGKLKPCVVCNQNNWILVSDFISPPVWHYNIKEFLFLGNSKYPHFALTCRVCGNTQFINAVVAGVVPGGSAPT